MCAVLTFHLDRHHKLIRWRLVTHGGLDGYSRMVVYFHCSNNNCAATVYNLFLAAVRQYWLPSRVRADQGGENMLVAQHMLTHRGRGRGSIITGSSTHNQRIERFWRDSHWCVTQLYYRLFYFLENRWTVCAYVRMYVCGTYHLQCTCMSNRSRDTAMLFSHIQIRMRTCVL